MPDIIRAALVQQSWTGDKDSMIRASVSAIEQAASDSADEVLVRDLDMGLLAEVRDLWQFYRDRRPDQYDRLVQP